MLLPRPLLLTWRGTNEPTITARASPAPGKKRGQEPILANEGRIGFPTRCLYGNPFSFLEVQLLVSAYRAASSRGKGASPGPFCSAGFCPALVLFQKPMRTRPCSSITPASIKSRICSSGGRWASSRIMLSRARAIYWSVIFFLPISQGIADTERPVQQSECETGFELLNQETADGLPRTPHEPFEKESLVAQRSAP
jgi:hypothetical protein